MDLPLREPNINIMAELLSSHSQQHSTPNYCSFLARYILNRKLRGSTAHLVVLRTAVDHAEKITPPNPQYSNYTA